ncbi:hypothetical protein ACGC1H_001688 [Rhizoctonia solani]|uniref:Uncharacterized protein n=1 Tax=Rhizoctonia solani TaxID=456999 RepID=A0A8H3B2T5_9AGAM|nr:unnamed protein product [Rhizoctonia solani]
MLVMPFEAFIMIPRDVDVHLNRLDERFDTVDERLDAINKRFDVIDKRFDAAEATSARILKALAEVSDSLQTQSEQTAEVKNILLNRSLQTLDLANRVQTNESNMGQLSTEFKELKNSVSNIQNSLLNVQNMTVNIFEMLSKLTPQHQSEPGKPGKPVA